MKICYIAPLNSIHTQKWIKYFHDLGHEIHCIWNEKINNKIKWITYYSFDDKIKNNLLLNFFIFRLIFFTIFWLRIIKKINPDITHLHFLGFSSLIVLFYKSKKLVTTIWWSDILILPKKIPFYKYIIKRILNMSDVITMDWFNTYDEVLSYGIPKQKLKKIGFWIDTKKFFSSSVIKDNLLPLKIISLRNLDPIYDISTIINAAKILKDKWEKFHIDIYANWSEKGKLIDQTNILWLNEYISFLWRYDNTKLPGYLNNSDLYISVSLSDSWLAWSTGEAMACWLPVIATDNADNSKWITNEKNWYIIPEKSPSILADKILYFIKNRSLIKDMWNESVSVISKRNDYYNEMDKVNNIYKNI